MNENLNKDINVKIATILSKIIMSKKLDSSSKERKIKILTKRLSFLIEELSWEERESKKAKTNLNLNKFVNDVLNWLELTNKYYLHFPDEYILENKKEIEDQTYVVKSNNSEKSYTFKEIIKEYILKNNIPQNSIYIYFDIALLSIFTINSAKEQIASTLKINKNDLIYKLLFMKKVKSILFSRKYIFHNAFSNAIFGQAILGIFRTFI